MTLSTQFATMLAMIGMGCFLGAGFDTYNRFLKRNERKTWIVFVNDVLFWLLQGLIVFYVLFIVNEGELRFYIFLALLCGFAAYQSLIRHPYLKMLEWIIRLVVSVWRLSVKLFLNVIYKPILSLVAFSVSVIVIIGRAFFSLLILVGKTLLWIIRLLSQPVRFVLLIFWKFMPIRIKKSVEKIYNGGAGFFKKIQKYFGNMLNHLKKQK
jgi:spore cortex biosynthesis protein YabQ